MVVRKHTEDGRNWASFNLTKIIKIRAKAVAKPNTIQVSN